MKTVRRRNRSRPVRVVAMGSVIVLTLATSAWASHAHLEISIPVDTIVEATQGSTTQLATTEVPEDFANHLCQVRAHAQNQESTHPNNDLLVESGDSQVLLADVEAKPNQVIAAEQALELGEVITVYLIMGPDEVFSAGIEVQVECLPAETTTTTTIAETTTTAEVAGTEVTAPSTTTTSIEAEVKGTEVLPFTGSESSHLGLVALGLTASGTLLLLLVRTRHEGE
jgi:LPXTG-motif cell wall-anchored protein